MLVGFRRDLQLHAGFTLRDIAALPGGAADIWRAAGADGRCEIYPYAGAVEISLSLCPQASGAGNGFGYGLVDPEQSPKRGPNTLCPLL